jgi:hypothetical protein
MSGPSKLFRLTPEKASNRKEAEMQMIGCDLHAGQQTLAILDTSSGVLEERVLERISVGTRLRWWHAGQLFTAYHLHQFGLGLEPVLISVFVGPVAGLIDLVSARRTTFASTTRWHGSARPKAHVPGFLKGYNLEV